MMKRFLYRLAEKADALPLRLNPYLEKIMLKHHKLFCVLACILSSICLATGIISFVCKLRLWFALLFLMAGFLSLVCTAYLAFAKCVCDQEKIEKRAIICLKRVSFCDIVLIRDVKQKYIDKRILLVYDKEKLLLDFVSPMKGMEDLLHIAKQKGIRIQRYTDVRLRQLLDPDVTKQ